MSDLCGCSTVTGPCAEHAKDPADTDDEKVRLFQRLRGDAWKQTYTGRMFVFEMPGPQMVDIEDVAHSLACVNRFGGHAKRPYNVAEHSCHVSDLLMKRHGPLFGFYGLMHEGGEPYVGDMSSPLKSLCDDYRRIERNVWEQAIVPKFNLPMKLPSEVKLADVEALACEAPQVMRVWPPPKPWNLPVPHERHFIVRFWGWKRAKEEFLDRYHRLRDALPRS